MAACTTDPNESYSVWLTAPRASPLLLCHTQIEPAWWITQWIMMDYKTGIRIKTHKHSLAQPDQQTLTHTALWFTAGWDHILLGFTNWDSSWISDAHLHYFICLTQVVCSPAVHSGGNRRKKKQSEMSLFASFERDSKCVAMVTLYIPLPSPLALRLSSSWSIHYEYGRICSWLT